MKRHVLGVLAATIAAPYLAALFVTVATVTLVAVKSPNRFDPLDLFQFVFHGTEAFLFLGAPVLLLSSFYAFLLHAFECRSRRGPIIGGAVLGLSFALVFAPARLTVESVFLLCTGLFPGAICGWIYWRIAIRQTPDNARPITNP
jgi:hypothetical protein